jgi:hypothetical protein
MEQGTEFRRICIVNRFLHRPSLLSRATRPKARYGAWRVVGPPLLVAASYSFIITPILSWSAFRKTEAVLNSSSFTRCVIASNAAANFR